ncbi:Caudovirales tail fiber assembly protein [Caballeronia turbans]|uniref:tail fiber assembly protein n=1 Tax=Caballeronia sp. INSB1 TaxID=2921751 RepID=UPI00074C3BCD|nr:tail fiber assembly protein [Caballeronia sp. INSB1]SAL25753.1 Caudovirales tail fiber assembly protein [Caballeronia turbans]
MKTYARIEAGVVMEIIAPMADDEGHDIPIEERFTPEFVATLVDVTDATPMPEQRWTYDGATFAAPVPYQPTPVEILAANTSTRDALLASAALAIAPLQDAVDLDMATDAEKEMLTRWKQYRVAVNRVDLAQTLPIWTSAPSAS